MPSLNLRLSREEHEALVARAAANGRSLQREIVWMLNRGLEGDGSVEGARGVRPDQSFGSDTSAATGLGVDVPVAAPRSPSKKCVREARHHINHSGNPCPECGWPSFRPGPKGGSGK